MAATKTFKPAKDGTSTAFNLEMAAEAGSGNIANATYLAEPVGETLVSPANAANQTTTNTKLDSINTTLGAPAQAVAQGSTTSGQTGTLAEGAVTTGAPAYTTGQTSPLSLTPVGALRTDGSAVIQPVSGAFFQATQPVSLSALPALAASANIVGKVDLLGNAGAAMDAAGQNAASPPNELLVGGQFNTTPTILTSGNVSPFQLDANANLLVNVKAGGVSGNVAQGSTTSGETGMLAQGAVTTGAPVYTTGQTNPLSLTPTGNLRVDGSTVTQPVSAASLPLPAGAATSANQATAAAQGSATSGQTGPLIQAAVTTGAPVYTTAQTSPLSLDTGGLLRVRVDAGSASGNVGQGSTTAGETGVMVQGAVTTSVPAYTTAQTSPLSLTTTGGLRVDGSAVTQPVSAASLPLPAGAATAAKQPALGTAGTSSADVITVQGSASMTPVVVDGSGVTQPISATSLPLPSGAATAANQPTAAAQGSATSGQSGVLMQAAATTTPSSYTTGQTSPLSMNLAGGLRVDGSGVTQPMSAASLPLPSGAATSAKQPALGTLGSPSADVITIQGGASMTPVKVDASATAIQGATVGSPPPAGANTVMMGVKDSVGNVAQLALDAGGAINAGFDGLQVSPASVTSAATIFTQDMTGYEGIAVHVTSPGTTCTITYETGEDNTNWRATTGMDSGYLAGYNPTSTSTAAGLMTFPRRGRYFRARVSTYTSGTVTLLYSLLKSHQVIPSAAITAAGQAGSGNAMQGSPVPMGFDARTSNLTVTNGQAVYGVSTLNGAQIIQPWSIPELTWQFSAAVGGVINTTTAVTLIAAAGAGVRNYCTRISFHTNGTNAASEIAIRDGAAGTVIWRGFMTANQANNFQPMAFEPPLKGTANTLMEFVTLTAGGAGSALYVNAQGFQAA